MKRFSRSITLVLSLMIPVLAGCDDDPVAPREVVRADIIGSYSAEVLEGTSSGVTIDALAIGGSLTLELHDDGTTTGRLIVPDVGDGPVDADLAGTFTFNDATDRIAFQLPGDNFLQEIELSALWFGGHIRLEGQETFGNESVHVILDPT